MRITKKHILGFLCVLSLMGCGDRGFTPASSSGSALDETPSQPFFEGERTIPLQTYLLPKVVTERLEEEAQNDQSLKRRESYRVSKAAEKFELEGLDFTVDITGKVMRFKGKLRSQGGRDEEILLEGSFDPTASLWTSDDMFPVDTKVRSEKRMQATAVCLDSYVCDRVAVRFYVRHGDEVLSLHFEKDAVSVGEASSGHDESEAALSSEEEHENFDDLIEPIEQLNSGLNPEKKDKEKKDKKEAADADDELFDEPSSPPPAAKETPKAAEPPKKSVGARASGVFEDPRYVGEVLEYNGPTITPQPRVTPDSIKGIEKFAPPSGATKARIQAIGRHNSGRLEAAKTLPLDGPGYTRRDRKESHPAYGTDLLVSLIQQAAKTMESSHPGRPPVSVGHLSAKTGRKLGGHSSHQHGLDVDIAFPRVTSQNKSFWDPRTRNGLNSEMDKERFWKLSKSLVCSKTSNSSHVMVIFLDSAIKKQMCAYAKSLGENLSDKSSCAYQTLRSIKHWKGHHHHIHVRAYCPGTTGCSNTEVSLPQSTGC